MSWAAARKAPSSASPPPTRRGAPVVAGPVEATVAGNMLCQLLAAGGIVDLEEGRAIVRRSHPQTIYEPRRSGDVERAYEAFLSLKAAGSKEG